MIPKDQAEEIVTRIRNELGEKIDFIVLFGSASTGYKHPMSDIDVGVFVSAPKDELHSLFADLLSLFDFVDESSPKVDITLLNLASLTLLFRVICDGKLLYEKNTEVWPTFVEYVLSRYPDWNYYLENYLKQSLGVTK